MKKCLSWSVAALTTLVSLAALCLFDLLLRMITYYLNTIPFFKSFSEIIGEIIGAFLGIGLCALAAIAIAVFIWSFGIKLIGKIEKQKMSLDDTPLSFTNILFLILFIGAGICLAVFFALSIAGTVASYTAGFQGFAAFLQFFKAIKDTAITVCADHFIVYLIGTNSFLLFIIHCFNEYFL